MSLPQYWLSKNRKDLAEQAIITRRDQEAQSARRRESVDRYHKDLNRLSAQYKNLEEGQSGKLIRVNQESRLVEEAKDRRKAKIYERQQKLTLLLAEDNDKYLGELKAISEKEMGKEPWNIAKLKEQIEELRKNRIHDEEALHKRNMLHMYHPKNSAYELQHDTNGSKKDVSDAWEKQKLLFERQSAERSEEERKMRQDLVQQRLEANQCAETADVERQKMSEEFAKKYKELSAAVESNSAVTEKLKMEAKVLENHQVLLQNVVKKRKQVQEIQKQREKKIEMFRPSKEKVRKMAGEVSHLLEVDLSTLKFLNQLGGGTDKEEESISNLDLKDVLFAKEAITQFVNREQQRDSELAVLFEEEAVKLWNCRKQLWEKELETHEKIMSSLFNSLATQIESKVAECLLAQEKTLETQRKLLDELTEENQKGKERDRELLEKRDFYLNKTKELDDRMKKLLESSRIRSGAGVRNTKSPLLL